MTLTESLTTNRYRVPARVKKLWKVFKKYISFLGPGIMVSVSFMDPGNYSTSVSASKFQYKLLFSIFISNLMAIFLQTLCAKLGAVTGLDLAQNCKKNFSPRVNLVLYILTEIAIIATDLAEVIGTAIALNILLNLPLFLGVVLTIVDVIIVLMAYRPNGPMIVVRIFEALVSCLVLGTVICFAIELITISDKVTFKEIFYGFMPSKTVIKNDALYLSLAILGATVMPHSLYLGSGLVKPRLKEYDVNNGNYSVPRDENGEIKEEEDDEYRPTIDAIDETMAYTITELVVSLFTIALFVNSAILIIAAATFSTESSENTVEVPDNADLFTIYQHLTKNLTQTAGTIFALALLFSGLSAGVVCTLAGQIVSEGFLDWSINPSLRRMLTRAIAILPCLIFALISGREGLTGVLNFSQVLLSLLLPFVSAPLVIFTNSKNIMTVEIRKSSQRHQNSNKDDIQLENLSSVDRQSLDNTEMDQSDEDFGDSTIDDAHSADQRLLQTDTENLILDDDIVDYVDFSNGKLTKAVSIFIWLFITVLNFYLIISLALGKDIPL